MKLEDLQEKLGIERDNKNRSEVLDTVNDLTARCSDIMLLAYSFSKNEHMWSLAPYIRNKCELMNNAYFAKPEMHNEDCKAAERMTNHPAFYFALKETIKLVIQLCDASGYDIANILKEIESELEGKTE